MSDARRDLRGTGPAGRGLALATGGGGVTVTIGSRDAERACRWRRPSSWRQWPEATLAIRGGDNAAAAAADLVVVATPWDGVGSTAQAPGPGHWPARSSSRWSTPSCKDGREMLALIPPRGSMAAAVQAALPDSWSRPPSTICRPPSWRTRRPAWPPTCSSAPTTARPPEATMDLVDAIEGLRALDAGSLAQASADRGLHRRLHHLEHPLQGPQHLATGRDLNRRWRCGSTTPPAGRWCPSSPDRSSPCTPAASRPTTPPTSATPRSTSPSTSSSGGCATSATRPGACATSPTSTTTSCARPASSGCTTSTWPPRRWPASTPTWGRSGCCRSTPSPGPRRPSPTSSP